MTYFEIFIFLLSVGLLVTAISLASIESTPANIYPSTSASPVLPSTPVSPASPPLETLRAKLQTNTDGTTQTFWVEFGDGEEISIDWGDGSTETASKQAFHGENKIGVYEPKSHTYALSGTYDLQISGSCNSMVFSPPGLQTGSIDLTEIVQLGHVCATVEKMCLNNATITKFTAGESSPYTSLNEVCKDCKNLTQVDLTGVSSSVLSADSAWEGCIALTTFDTSTLPALTSAKRCWAGCIGLTTFSSAGLLDAKILDAAWEGCTGLTTFDNTDGFPALSEVKNSPFAGCTNLTTFINVRGFAKLNTNALALTFFLDLKNTVVSFNNSNGFASLQDCSNLFSNFAAMTTFDNTSGLASGTTFAGTWAGAPLTTFNNAYGFPNLNDNGAAIALLSDLKTSVVNFDNTGGFAALEDCSNLFNGWPFLETFNNTSGLASGNTFVDTWLGSNITTFDNTGAFPLLDDNVIALAYLGNLKNTVVNFNNTEGFASLQDCRNLFNGWLALATFNNTRGLASGNMFAGTWAGSSLLTTFDNTEAFIELNDNGIALDYLSSLKTTVANFNNTGGFASLENCDNLFNTWLVLANFNNTRGLASGTTFAGTWTGSPITTFDNTGAFPLLTDRLVAIAYLGNLKNTVVNFNNTDGFASILDCKNLFKQWPELTIFDNTRGLVSATSVNSTWALCPKLASFETSSLGNVTICTGAWNGCSAMTSFSAAGLLSVDSLNLAWQNCIGLTSFSTTGLSTATTANSAWFGCNGLTSFSPEGLSGLVTANSAWSRCTRLTTFDTSVMVNVTSCVSAWLECSDMTSFSAAGLSSSTNINLAWRDCVGLTEFSTTALSAVLTADSAWSGCTGLLMFSSAGLSSLSTMNSAWSGCIGLTTFDTLFMINATNITGAWSGCESLATFSAAGLNGVTLADNAWNGCTVLNVFTDYEGNTAVTSQVGAFVGTPLVGVVLAPSAWITTL